MGALAKLSWQRMDNLFAEHGKDGVLDMICMSIAGGFRDGSGKYCDPLTLEEWAQTEGINYSVVWSCLKKHEGWMDAYKAALEARADSEAHRTIKISDKATPETLGVDTLRVKTRLDLIKKWDRDRYGDQSKVAVDVRYQVDLLCALEEAEERRRRLNEKVIEGEVI